ncbi:hypothetical protein [Conexibacter woesei]|uniref:hypothetical protein n=1 Tax=Conexibacter woesei TaxID=191495 RepID=UPI0003F6B6A9|nr:hypothetical protein [Conexibacter woesei]
MPAVPPRVLPLIAVAALAALPAAAHAAVTAPVGLSGHAVAVLTASDGNVHVVERAPAQDEVFAPDGTRLRTTALPASAPEVAVADASGGVWIGDDGAGGHPGFTHVAADGTLTRADLGAAFGCTPSSAAFDATTGTLFFGAPDDPAQPCAPYGIGAITPDGTVHAVDDTDTGEWVSALAAAGGKLWAGSSGDATVRRYDAASLSGPDARTTLSNDATTSALAVRPDGQIDIGYAAGDGSGHGSVVRIDPNPPLIGGWVADTDTHGIPVALGEAPDGTAYAVLSGGTEGLEVISPRGAISYLPSLDGGHVAVTPDALWTVAADALTAKRYVDGPPVLSGVHVVGTALVATIDPRGNDTYWTAAVGGAGVLTLPKSVSGSIPAGTAPVRVSAELGPFATTGDWPAYINTFNHLGAQAATTSIHAIGTYRPPPARQPRTPAFTQLASLPSGTSCIPNRTVRVTRRSGRQVDRFRALTIRIDNAKPQRFTGAKLTRAVTIHGLPRHGSYRVRVSITLANGRTVTTVRHYRACAPRHRPRRAGSAALAR